VTLSAPAPAPASNGPAAPVSAPVSQAPLAFEARLLALNAAVAAARDGAVGQAALPAEHELRQLAGHLGATATGLSAPAAGPPTGADPGGSGGRGNPGDPGGLGDPGDLGGGR